MRYFLSLLWVFTPLISNAEQSLPPFEFSPPAGMCALEGKTEAEQLLVDFITMGNMGANSVLLVFADCAQLKDFRAEKRNDLNNYGSISIPQLGERYKGSRAEYIAEAREALAKQSALLGAMGIQRAGAAADETGERLGVMGFGLESAEFLGEVGASGSTVQIGTVQTNKTPGGGEAKKVAGVATMSLLKGEQIVVNMHALYEGKQTIEALRSRADNYYKKLIAAND